MTAVIYVILIDGRPYRKDGGAIRTYTSRERAEDRARQLAGYWSYRGSTLAVGMFTTVSVTPVITEVDGE
jgi:hypothetical protein